MVHSNIFLQIPAFLHCHADKILRTGKYLNVIQQCDDAKSDVRRRRNKKKRVVIFNSFSDVIDGGDEDEPDEGLEGDSSIHPEVFLSHLRWLRSGLLMHFIRFQSSSQKDFGQS